jgi:hypothetical protein
MSGSDNFSVAGKGRGSSGGSTIRRLAISVALPGFVWLAFIPAASAQSIPFTDADGNKCTTDMTELGPNGETLCPQSLGGGGAANSPIPSIPNIAIPYQRAVQKLNGVLGNEFWPYDWDPDKVYNGAAAEAAAAALGAPPDVGAVPQSVSQSVLPAHLGIYTSPYGGLGGVQADGFGISGRGSTITDSSGAFSGATTSDFHGTGGGGGISGSIALMPNVEAGGRFDYQHVSLNFGGAGSERVDDYTFAGYLKYYWQDSYAGATLSYSFVPANTFNSGTGATGSFNTNGLNGDVRVGHVFTLVDTMAAAVPGRVSKAPAGGYGLLLDVSGHGGYSSALSDGFADSTGFILGASRYEYGDIGANARLEALVPTPGILWIPYIEASVDQHLGNIDTLNLPAQTGVTVADTINYSDANTYWGGRIGLSTETRSGLSVGVSGFISESSDLRIVGGQAFIKVQF